MEAIKIHVGKFGGSNAGALLLWILVLALSVSSCSAENGTDASGSGEASTSPSSVEATATASTMNVTITTPQIPITPPNPCSECDGDRSMCGAITNNTCICNSGYTGDGKSCAQLYVIKMPTISEGIASANTSTTVFGIESTSAGAPWTLRNTYHNLRSNDSIAELSQPGLYIIRTCRSFLYTGGVRTQTCDAPFFASSFDDTGIVGAIVDWVNKSAAGSENLFQVSPSEEGAPEVSFILPNITGSIYRVWLVEYRQYLAACQVNGSEENVQFCSWMSMEVGTSEERAMIQLAPGVYEIRLHAETRPAESGRRRRRRRMAMMTSLYTPPLLLFVPPAAPSLITALSAHDTTSQSLNVSWTPPAAFNGVPLPYSLNFTQGSTLVFARNVTLTDANDTVAVFFGNLSHYTAYAVSVVASSSGGSSAAVTGVFTTYSIAPGPVQNLRANSSGVVSPTANTTSATLQWTPPSALNGPITHYEVRYRSARLPAATIHANNTTSTMVVVPDLRLGTLHSFEVAAYTSAGRGPFSAVNDTTPPGIPRSAAVTMAALGTSTVVSLLVAVSPASDDNGPVVDYAVLVSRCNVSNHLDVATSFQTCTQGCLCPTYVAFVGMLTFSSNGQSLVRVGNSSTVCELSDVVCNAPLEANTSYTIAIRAYTQLTRTGTSGGLRLADLSAGLFSQVSVTATTAPNADTGGRGGGGDGTSDVAAGAVVGAVLGSLGCIALFAGGFYYLNHTESGLGYRSEFVGLMRRHSRVYTFAPTKSMVQLRHDPSSGLHVDPEEAGNAELTKVAETDLTASQIRRLRVDTPHNISRTEVVCHPQKLEGEQYHSEIAVAGFVDYVNNMAAHSDLGFAKTYEVVKAVGQHHTCETSMVPENRGRNRYSNIVSYDHSRVPLRILNGRPETSYINANFVDHPDGERAYIATQGPMATTVPDFWRMIWEQQCGTIIMVTNLEEKGRVKCHRYWPCEGDVVDHRKNVLRFTEDLDSALTVEMISEQVQAFATVRTFFVSMGVDTRQVNQYHFTHWPDHGVPETPDDLLRFVLGVRAYDQTRSSNSLGPAVVHCSAGVGRTGTYIAVDSIARQLLSRDLESVDLLNIACQMRWQRVSMIQTEGQFIYVYHCVAALIDYITDLEKKTPNLTRNQLYTRILEDRYKIC